MLLFIAIYCTNNLFAGNTLRPSGIGCSPVRQPDPLDIPSTVFPKPSQMQDGSWDLDTHGSLRRTRG